MIENHLLAALPRKEYEALQHNLEPVTLNVGDVLHEAEGRITYVYFPNRGVVSIISVLGENASVKLSGSGRGKATNKEPAKKGGKKGGSK